MLDFNVGSVFEAVQHIRDDRERESVAIMLLGMALSAVVQFSYSLGMGIQTKGKFLRWMGYSFTHTAATIYKIALEQDFAPRIIIGAPMDLVKNSALLDSIHVEEIQHKK